MSATPRRTERHADEMYRLGRTAGQDYPQMWDDNRSIESANAGSLSTRARRLASRGLVVRYAGWLLVATKVAVWLAVLVTAWTLLTAAIPIFGQWMTTDSGLGTLAATIFDSHRPEIVHGAVLVALLIAVSALRSLARTQCRRAVRERRDSLYRIGLQGLLDCIEERRDAARHGGSFAGRTPTGVVHAAPFTHPEGVTPQQAEELVAQWMRYLGAEDACATQYSRDGGIDVQSSRYIAQVKNYTNYVGVAPIREFIGVAAMTGRWPLFFTSGSYSREAIKTADAARMPLFVYNAYTGSIEGANQLGREVMRAGLTR